MGFFTNEQQARLFAQKAPEERVAGLAAMPEDQRAEVERLIPQFLPADEIIGKLPAALKRQAK